MHTVTVAVGSSIGLHARPAAVIAEAVIAAGSEVTLAVAGEEPVPADSALMIMTLGATQGTEVTVAGEDATAVDRIAELVAQDLDA